MRDLLIFFLLVIAAAVVYDYVELRDKYDKAVTIIELQDKLINEAEDDCWEHDSDCSWLDGNEPYVIDSLCLELNIDSIF